MITNSCIKSVSTQNPIMLIATDEESLYMKN